MPLTQTQRPKLSTTLLLFALISQTHGQIRGKPDPVDDPLLIYKYQLSSNSPFGIIPYNAFPGSEVPLDSSHGQDGQSVYLKLYLFENRQPTEAKHTTNTTSSTTKQPAILLRSIPASLLWDISGRGSEGARILRPGLDDNLAFSVNSDMGIVVSNPTKFTDVQEVEFWVVLIRRQKSVGDEVVSNPVAFIITIDYNEASREGAAVYAAIVLAAVCLFALLIPLTVRTKRRMREGKPVCACGSSSRKKEERLRRAEGGDSPVGARTDDIAILFNEGHQSSVSTIQSHNMRSVTEPHFQPEWLDPHYQHGHEHPRYHKPRGYINSSASSASLARSSAAGTSGANGQPATSSAGATPAGMKQSPPNASLTKKSSRAPDPPRVSASSGIYTKVPRRLPSSGTSTARTGKTASPVEAAAASTKQHVEKM